MSIENKAGQDCVALSKEAELAKLTELHSGEGVNQQLLAEYPDEMANGEKMANCNTDCRSAEGVTVGLIDGLITIARVLTKRDLSPAAVQEALIDLRSDEDLARVLDPAIRKGVNQQLLEALE